jgi:hypothetical protein
VLTLGTAGYLSIFPNNNPFQQVNPTLQIQGNIQPTGSPTVQPANSSPTATATYTPIAPDVALQMDTIQQQVVQIRGLQAQEPVTRVLITPAQLAQRVLSDFTQQNNQKDVQDNSYELIALGLISPDFDLYHYLENLQTEEIAGFYDDKIKEMFVVSSSGFGGNEKWTYSHEYTHALQDQNYNIEHGLNYNDLVCKTESERCAAIQALMEGDASLTALDWVKKYASLKDITQIQKYADSLKLPVYDQAPDFLKQDFNFPYEQGQDFVQFLYNKGGWDAVNQAFKNPPVSTAQILHPELYPDQKPITITLPNLSTAFGAGWRELELNSLGEWYTYLMLAHGIDPKTRLDDTAAKAAVQGWAGDTYVAYYNDQLKATTIVLVSIWGSTQQAQQFASAFQSYSNNRFGTPTINETNTTSWSTEGIYAEFNLTGNRTTWIYAPDAFTAQAIWKALQKP